MKSRISGYEEINRRNSIREDPGPIAQEERKEVEKGDGKSEKEADVLDRVDGGPDKAALDENDDMVDGRRHDKMQRFSKTNSTTLTRSV